MKPFIRELRRRNVVRVAVLYAVVGWLVLQVADLAMPRLGIPPWGVSFVIVVVLLGFPLALIFAWAFELTPEGIKRTQEIEQHESITPLTSRKLNLLIIGVLAAALVYVVVDSYVLQDAPGPGSPKSESSDAGAALVSIAVLPFVDMSQAKDQEYLTDGISEELLNVLAKVEGYKVTGRTSAFAFKARNEDLRTIGQKLGVENILEGSVRKQGDRIRVTAQLVKAADGYHLWSDTYDRQLGDVFAIQDDIARQVVNAIQRTLGGASNDAVVSVPTERKSTPNVEAYTQFLRGQHLLRARERTSMETALAQFERAAELDPDFARAHAGIANALLLLVSYRHRMIGDVEQRVRSEIERALELDPELGEAFAAKANLLLHKYAPPSEQIALLERAVALNPGDSQTLVWLAVAHGDAGRPDDEMREFARAYAVDPLMPVLLSNYALASQRRGDVDTARRLIHEIEALQPGAPVLLRTRAMLGLLAGRVDEWIRWTAAQLKVDPDDPGAIANLVSGYSMLGDVEAVRRQSRRLTEVAGGTALELAARIRQHLLAGEGQRASALVATGQDRFASDVDYLTALPVLGDTKPSLVFGPSLFDAPHAVFLLRETGEAAQATKVAEAAIRYLDGKFKPSTGPEQGFSLYVRSQIAAVNGDRASTIANLAQLYDTGGLLPAFAVSKPWFRPHRADPVVVDLLAKFDARRAEWRRQLAREDL